MASIRVIFPCYLSNEFAAIKETILLLFVDEVSSRASCFSRRCLFYDLFLGRNVDGFAGEMQMFENLAAEA